MSNTITNAKYKRYGSTGLIFSFKSNFEFDFDKYKEINNTNYVDVEYCKFIPTMSGYYRISYYGAYDRSTREIAKDFMDLIIIDAIKGLERIKENGYVKI